MIKQGVVRPGVTPSAESGKKSSKILNKEAAAKGERPRDIQDLDIPIESSK